MSYVSAANENNVRWCNGRNSILQALLLAMVEPTKIMLAKTIASIKATCHNIVIQLYTQQFMDSSTVLV